MTPKRKILPVTETPEPAPVGETTTPDEGGMTWLWRLSGGILLLLAVLIGVGCVLSVLEWRIYPAAVLFPGQGYAFPAYTRASLLCFATALLIAALRWQGSAPPVVDVMARYSLALYCLHLFVAEPMRLVVQALVGGIAPLGQAWALIGLTIAGSYIAAKVLSLVWKDRLLF